MKFFLYPLSLIYSAVTWMRNWLYDRRWFKVYTFPVPIVSVGNLTWGGTGKTPVICEIVQWAEQQGFSVAVISRGYRGQVQGVERVPANADPRVYGDEPAMMACRFPRVPIYVGADRVQAVRHILATEDVKLILADDAFQHRRLHRDLDVLVVDCVEKIENYAVAPAGRAREPLSAIRRADYLILNKVNLVDPQIKLRKLEFVEELLARYQGIAAVIESEYYIKNIVSLDGTQTMTLPALNQNVLLASGIGNPLTFERIVANQLQVKKHMIFRDHHDYLSTDVQKMLAEALALKVDKILVTEKDAVKLRKLCQNKENIWVLELAPKLSLRVKQLYEAIGQLVR